MPCKLRLRPYRLVNLLRTDLRVVAERSVATEKQVTCLQSEIDTLKASVAILEAKTHKLEVRVEDAEGRARRCNLRIVGFPKGMEGANVETFLEDWICKTLPDAPLSAVFVVECVHRALQALPPPGAPPRTIIARVLNYRDRDVILQEVHKHGDPTFENHIIRFFPHYTRMVQFQRQSFTGVKRRFKELGYTHMLLFPAKLKVLHAGRSHFFQSPEAAWDWLERNDVAGTPDSVVGESDRRPRGTAEVHTAARRST
ncbi:hypothetical protein NDU88_000416 [Pleurodeles waltl]|uniref:Uncharacterized protein n=1 Tax=Pleurodeles waltl TaxID=8319 RepID=A0AAV7N7X8_PLEWA|nr:hypothetical protein NDU88_000416 [Pleurodeles waltl]